MIKCFSPYGAIDRAFGRLPLAAGTLRLEKVPLDLLQVLDLKGDVPVPGAEGAPIVVHPSVACSSREPSQSGGRWTGPVYFLSASPSALFLHQLYFFINPAPAFQACPTFSPIL